MPAKKKPSSAADFRMKEEADKKKAKASSRTDFAGTRGFGDTMSSFNKNNEGIGSKYYKSKADKSAEGFLKSKGLDPDKQGSKGATLRGDFAQSNYPKKSSKFLGVFEHDFRGKTSVNGIPQLWKNSVSVDSYNRIKKAVDEANFRGMNSKGQVVPQPKPKKKK